MTEIQRKLTVWVVSDGVAGHYRQSEGVVLALQQLADVEAHWLTIRLKNGVYRQLLKWQINRGTFPMATLRLAYQDMSLPEQRPDVVIGAGGKSMYAVAVLAKYYQAKAIFIGSLRGLSPQVFDAVLTIDADLPAPYVSLPVAPMPITADTLAKAKADWQKVHPNLVITPNKPVWAMLIGGDGAGVHYSQSDWQQLAKALNALANKHGIQWLVTTSRRTPTEAETVLQQMLNPDAILQAVYWHQAPQKVMQAYLALASRIFVTAESMTMVTEAIYAKASDGDKSVSACLPLSLGELASQDANHARHLQALVDKELLTLTDMRLIALDSKSVTPSKKSTAVGLDSLLPILAKIIQ